MQRRNLVVKVFTAFVETSGIGVERVTEEICINLDSLGRDGSRMHLFDEVEQTPCIAISVGNEHVDGSFGGIKLYVYTSALSEYL